MRIPNWRVFHEIEAVIVEIENEMSESTMPSQREIVP